MSEYFGTSGLVQQLGNLTPGHLPEPVFEAIARLVVTPTFVVVPVFRRGVDIRVMLTRRALEDSQYPGMLHPPGKILLATDKDLNAAFERLVATELSGLGLRAAPVFVTHFFERITRGHEISMVHYLEVKAPSDDVPSYDPNNLPKDVIQTDIPRIRAAAEAFRLASQ